MANKNRDVELVVRAKNEASKTFTSVAEALALLEKAQDDVSRSAGKTSGFVEKLGAELNRLNAESKGLDALSKISGNMDRATAAITRMENTLAESNQEFARLSQESERAAANLKKLEAGLAGAKNAFQKQTAAAAEAKNEQSRINAQVRQAEAAFQRLATRVSAAKTPNLELAESYIDQENALQSLLAKQQRAASAYSDQKNKVAAAAQSLKEYQAQIKAAGNNQRDLRQSTEQIANSIDRQNRAIAKSKADLAGITATANQVSSALGGVATASDKVAQRSAANASAIEQVNKALAAQKGLSGNAAGAGAGVQASAQLQAARALRQAREEYKALSAEATRLGQAVATATPPTAELRQQFLLAQAAASQAKSAYEAQAASLSRLRGITQGTIGAFLQRTTQTRAAASADQQAGNSARSLASTLAALARALFGIQGAARQSAGAMGNLKSSFSAFYGESRQALSFFQRLRGELLGLSTQFVGFYAAVQNIGGVVNAYRTIEAAQNRLGAVFKQDGARVNNEMKFLEGNAARLGIEFGVLSNEYAKFAVAADAANFSNDATRKIFLSVAEAARVNKLSIEDTSGVFLALQQIISKGKVSSEELRRQLGDRLPGAFNIFADAIGMTTAELDKALQQGEVFATQDTLLKFADQLTDRFGAQLPQALQSVTTEIGKFQNNIFQAQNQVANGGFMEAFKRGLQEINKFFQSKEGVQFFTQLGAVMGKITDLVVVLVKNFDLLAKGIQLIVAFKLAQVFTQAANSMVQFVGQTQRAGASLITFRGNALATAASVNSLTNGLRAAGFANAANSIRGLAAGFITAARGATLLRVGFTALAGGARVLMTALGGPIGLLITLGTIIATELFANWATDVDTATNALAEHERILRAVAEAYGDVNAKIEDGGKKLKDITAAQVAANTAEIADAMRNVGTEMDKLVAKRTPGFLLSFPVGEAEKQAQGFISAAREGKISADQLAESMTKLVKETTSLDDQKAIAPYVKLVEEFIKLRTAGEDNALLMRQLGLSMNGLGEAADAAQKRIDELNNKTKDTAPAINPAVEATKKFNDSLDELKKNIPGLADELKKFDALEKIEADFKAAAAQAQTFGQVMQALDLANQAKSMVDFNAASGFSGKTTALIKQFEGFRSTPYYDVNAFRAGFGSDTVTLADGSIQKVVQGMRVSMEDANRDLSRRIGEFASTVQKQIGGDRFGQLNADQQAALTSIAYNYGSLPERLVAAIKSGNTESIVATIRSLSTDNGGVNAKRRNLEADIFASGGRSLDDAVITENLKAQTAELEKQAELKKKMEEDQAKARENFQQQIADNQFELANLQESARQQFINNQLREQELKYKQAGIALTDQEKQKIIESAGALFDKQNAEKLASEEKQRVEQAVNQLIEQRKELLEQIAFAEQQGDTAKTTELKAKLEETNTQLTAAITNAQEFWAKMGGAEADLAKLKLDGVKNSLVEVKKGFIDAKQVNDLFINGLSNAFSSVAESIAGVISGTLSLKDGLKAVGQAFLKFAADFLLQIGQMIVKQALLNALTGAGGGGGIGGFLSGLFHAGGIVGAPGGRTRLANPAWFSNAPRLHGGGIPGLKQSEVPAILQEGEEVLTRDDPRNALNGGLSGGGGTPNVKIINAFDASSYLSEAINSPVGEKAILNYLKNNSGAVKQVLG